MATLRDLLGRFKAQAAEGMETPANSTPEGFIDYVVRIVHPTRRMRSQVIRTTSEDLAIQAVIESLQGADLTGWSLLDVATVDEAQRRAESGGLR